MLKPTKILVPTDFSEHSDRAFRQALDIAKEYHAAVYLLHVVPDVQRCVIDYCLSDVQAEDIEQRAKDTAMSLLKKQIENFPQSKDVEVVADVAKGPTSEEILRTESEKGVDLIVIASLGKSGMAKYLISDVARNVLKGAKSPVLLTK